MSARPSRRAALAAATALLAAAALLAGCSDAPKPTPLEKITPKIAGHQVWKMSFSSLSTLAGSAGFQAQGVAAAGKDFVIAALNGTVVSVDADSGKENWRADAGGSLSSGVGTDGRFSAVVTRGGELVTFEGGKVKWRQHLQSAVVTAPFVAGERVFTLGVDRSVNAFDALDGTRIWTYAKPGDALTLSQAGVLTSYQDTLLAGQGARLTALDPLKGTVRWEVPVAAPRGTNEVERLADLVGPAARVGNVYCIRAFQNGIGCVDAERVTALWSINAGGSQPVGADEDYVFAADGSDRLSARRRSNGESVWLSDKFQNRRLSGMLSIGTVLVFGDLQGWVHFLDRKTGDPLLRLETDGSQIVGTPVRAGNTIAVTTKSGGVFAFRPE
ncbi:MAG: PQQ-binding-like beta-propeller repeat protein [Burkholderiaceae bacterium]